MSRKCQQKKPSDYCNNALEPFTPDKWLQCKKGEPAGHLFDGLAWLLRAAQEWQTQKEMDSQLGGYSVQVFAMDSVFLRTRSLFEFFTGTGRHYCHAQCLFGLDKQLVYPPYSGEPKHSGQWAHVLHVGSMHFQNRGGHLPLIGHDGVTKKELKEMPVDFAQGVLDVWRDFEAALQAKTYEALHTMAVACRRQAAAGATALVESVVNRTGAYQKLCGSHDKVTKLFEDQRV